MDNLNAAGTFWWTGFFAMIIFWALIIWALYALFRKTAPPPHKDEKPMEILKERYAKGEIDDKQFEEMARKIKDIA